MSLIIPNKESIPHQAIVFTNQKNLNDFSLRKIALAYNIRKECLGSDSAIWEIEFHLTNRCNLNCPGCSYGTRHNEHSLSLEQVLHTIEYYESFDLKSVFFSGGGDPLLWEHWDKFFSSISKTCSYGISTNMYNFGSIQNYWYMIDFYQIHVTGYSDRTTNIKTGISSFSRINKNIEFLSNHKRPSQNITLKMMISRNNYEELSYYLNYIADKGADSVVVKFEQDFMNNRNTASDEVINRIREKAYSHPIASNYDYLIDNLDDIVYKTFPCPEKCIFANSGLYRLINAEGEFYPCIASNYSKSHKIDYERGFVDIYSKEMLNGNCPLKACRHYRFSQYLAQMKNQDISNFDMSLVPFLL